MNYSKSYLKSEIVKNLGTLRVKPETASNEKYYKAVSMVVNKLLENKSKHF